MSFEFPFQLSVNVDLMLETKSSIIVKKTSNENWYFLGQVDDEILTKLVFVRKAYC